MGIEHKTENGFSKQTTLFIELFVKSKYCPFGKHVLLLFIKKGITIFSKVLKGKYLTRKQSFEKLVPEQGI